VLDAVALYAHQNALARADDSGGAGVASYTVGEMTYQYAGTGAKPPFVRMADALLQPYRGTVAAVIR
jgi:hypothetical protein